MRGSLVLRTLYEKRWFIVGWTAAIAGLAALMVAFFPSLSQGNTFQSLADTLPAQMQGLIGDFDSFNQLPNYLAVQLYDIRMPLFAMIMALVLAQSLSVSLEERGLMRTLLVTPLSRSRILFESWLAGVLIMGGIFLLTALLVGGSVDAIGETPPWGLIVRLNLMLWLCSIAAFSIPLAVGFATGWRTPTLAVGLVVAVGSFLFSTFAGAVDWLKNYEVLSLIHYYDVSIMLDGGFSRLHIWVLSLLSILALVIAVLLFRRRDVGA